MRHKLKSRGIVSSTPALLRTWLARGAREASPQSRGAAGAGAPNATAINPAAAAWLTAMSPFLLFLGASFMAHPAAMLAAGVILAGILDIERRALLHRTEPTSPRANIA